MTVEEIIKRKDELINIKKTTIKYSDYVINVPLKEVENAFKVAVVNAETEVEEKSTVKVIANTYYWLDSHSDVHVKGCFTKSISESLPAGKIFHFDNHNHSFSAKVGNVLDTTETKVNWKDLGVEKEGKTICVIGKTELIEDYNCQVYDAYENNQINQHSVGMQYVNLQLAVNSPTETEAYKLWNEVYPLLGNPEVADGQGYFWVVKEAKLKEYSCVLWNGSNVLTPTIKNIEPSNDTQNEDKKPSNDTLDTKNEKVIKIINPNLL